MVIILLAKIIKMSWFEHPELQGSVKDLMDMSKMSERHRYLSLLAINDLIVEMSYVHKVKNLTVNRRISLSFRDSALYQVFEMVIEMNYSFIDQLMTQQAMSQVSLNQPGLNQPGLTQPGLT